MSEVNEVRKLIRQYNPKKNRKYGKFVYSFLRKEIDSVEALGMPEFVFDKSHGVQWIGWFHGDAGRFTGTVIIGCEWKGGVTEYVFDGFYDCIINVPWGEYHRKGVCIFGYHFHQFRRVSKNSRRCEYCGRWQYRTVKTEKIINRYEAWEDERWVTK